MHEVGKSKLGIFHLDMHFIYKEEEKNIFKE